MGLFLLLFTKVHVHQGEQFQNPNLFIMHLTKAYVYTSLFATVIANADTLKCQVLCSLDGDRSDNTQYYAKLRGKRVPLNPEKSGKKGRTRYIFILFLWLYTFIT